MVQIISNTNIVFQVLVGNIPPNEDVRIELTYAAGLTEDEKNDSVRLNIPSHIGERYGEPSVAGTGSANAFINISVSVESVAPITQIGSSHAISSELGPYPSQRNAASLPSSHYARVSLTSDTPLNSFVLALTSSGLDAPRCIAEPHLTQDSVGVMFSFVPRFTLPDVP